MGYGSYMMDIKDFTDRMTGTSVRVLKPTADVSVAFVPDTLPPRVGVAWKSMASSLGSAPCVSES